MDESGRRGDNTEHGEREKCNRDRKIEVVVGDLLHEG